MKFSSSFVLFVTLAATGAQASWFSSDETPQQAWTTEQYAKAQKSFADLTATSFDAWDESRLREFLLEQGVVEPKGPREQMALLAKQKYSAYTSYASQVSASASSLSSQASTAVYGEPTYQASKSLSSIVAQATNEAARVRSDSTDYIYSSWDDTKLHSYLVEKGVIKSKSQATRDELLAKMNGAYATVANPIWEAWSTSYIHHWLVSHNIIKSDYEQNRDSLVGLMKQYYYGAQDTVTSTWSDAQLKQWLVDHNIVKSDAQIKRDKLVKLVDDNYSNAVDTIWGGWTDSAMRSWLIDNGYLRTDAQVKRDELVKLMNSKYNDTSARSAAYLKWPDARLRAYLREHNVSEAALPTSRPGLLQETRIRYVQTANQAESLYAKLVELVTSGVGSAEDKLKQIIALVTGTAYEGKAVANEKYYQGKHKAGEAADYANEKYYEGKHEANKKAGDYANAAGNYANDAANTAGNYANDAANAAGGYANDAANAAKMAAGEAMKQGGDQAKKGGEHLKGEL